MKTSKKMSNILFLFMVFPYISPIDTIFDTQPYALLFSLLIFIIFLFEKKILLPKPIFVLMVVMFYAFFIFLIKTSDPFNGLRSLFGYVSLFFISFAAYHTFNNVNAKHFTKYVWIWFGVGIVQFFLNRQFGSWILPRLSTTEQRGVTSLAVEPSYYAIICLFLLVLNDVFFKNERYSKGQHRVILFLLIIQVLLSYSGMGILLLCIYAFAKVISYIATRGISRSFVKSFMVMFLCFFLLWSFIQIPLLGESRAGTLVTRAVTQSEFILTTDYSVLQRYSHILISFRSLFHNYGLGFGLGNWNNHANQIASEIELISSRKVYLLGRTMSGWGSAIFELGLFGLLILLAFFRIMLYGIKSNPKMKEVYISSTVVIFAMMLTSVSLAFPLFCYCVGVFAYLSYKQPREKDSIT